MGKTDAPDVNDVQREVRAISDRLGGLVGQLDERQRDLFDVKRHPAGMIAVAVAVAGVVAGIVTWLVVRRRRRHSLPERVTVLREALRRISAHPERIAKSEGVTRKSLMAAGTAAASVVGRRLAQRLMG
jgi:hypothetical protein